MHFINFIGENKVGKTTMAGSLQGLLHRGCRYKTEIISFADSVREEMSKLYHMPDNIIFNKSINKNLTMISVSDYDYDSSLPALWLKHKLIKSKKEFKSLCLPLRDLLINHSTHIRRAEDPYYWVKLFDKKVNLLENDFDIVIIDDTRFDTEFEYLESKSIKTYHLLNGMKHDPDIAQDSVNNWILTHSDLIKASIMLPVPLTMYDADKFNVKIVIPNVPTKIAMEEIPEIQSIPRFKMCAR